VLDVAVSRQDGRELVARQMLTSWGRPDRLVLGAVLRAACFHVICIASADGLHMGLVACDNGRGSAIAAAEAAARVGP